MLVGMQNGQKNWASNVKNIFDMYDFSYILDNQESFQYKSYAVLIKNGLKMNSYRNGIHQLILLLHLYCIDISRQPLVMRTI